MEEDGVKGGRHKHNQEDNDNTQVFLFTHLDFSIALNDGRVSRRRHAVDRTAQHCETGARHRSADSWRDCRVSPPACVCCVVQVIAVNLTTDPQKRVELIVGKEISVQFSYSAHWQPTDVCLTANREEYHAASSSLHDQSIGDPLAVHHQLASCWCCC